jgi:tetratricopeptide (TPR) repeat protein
MFEKVLESVMNKLKGMISCRIWFLILIGIFALPSSAQEINLDKYENCGDLLCYQSLKDANIFYYLPDRPRIAQKAGRPQFSFLKYARVKETGEAGTGRAEGGGIVHFLVTYGADKNRVSAAERELQELYPDARLAGPIIYRKGSFALITSFKEGQTTTTRVVAVGKAPLMEGQKAAVSMALTREGAELLWESFQTATPDISLVFDMQFSGVREPYEATIEADWSRVAKSHRLQAGVKYAWFGADVDLLFQELRQSGAIKITTKGQHAMMDRIVESANARLLKVMFDPAPPDELTRAAAETTKQSYGNLGMAVEMLKEVATKRRSSGKRSLYRDNNLYVSSQMQNEDAWLMRLLDDLSFANWAVNHANADASKSDAIRKSIDEAFAAAKKAEAENNYSAALSEYNLILKLFEDYDPQHRQPKGWAKSYLNIGQTLRHLGHCEDALKYYGSALKEAVNISPPYQKLNFMAHVGSGRCQQTLGRYGEAIASYDKAIANLDYDGAEPWERKQLQQLKKDAAASAYNKARRLDEKARASGYQREECHAALEAWLDYQDNAVPTGQRAKEAESRVSYLEKKLAAIGVDKVTGEGAAGTPAKPTTTTVKTTPPGSAKPGAPVKRAPTATASRKTTGKAAASSRPPRTAASSRPPKKTSTAKRSASTAQSGLDTTPGFSLVASYRLRRIKRSGKFRYDMRHYRTETQAFPMAENIGDLYSRYGHDPKVFRAVTIDDPVFKQREVLVTLDGQDTDSFSKHLNFVTVQMEKEHQSGDLTLDEVVITPEKFNETGNAYSLSYGWKGDDDRQRWLDYRVKALWSFHGGVEISQPWSKQDSAMLSLEPPHRYRTITIEGDAIRLLDRGVRHAVVTVTSNIGDKTVRNQATIRNRGPAPSMIMEIPENKDGPPSQVEITWYLQGGKTVSSPMQVVEGDIVYWDELPQEDM